MSKNFAILQIKKLHKQAIIPQKGTSGAAGYDLCACQETTIPAKGKQLVKTGLSIAVPTGNYARIAPRSGLAWKNFIDVGAGVIDEDYRGEVNVLLFNHSNDDFKIAQMIIEKITPTIIQEVEELDETLRGEGGFGSTGVSLNKQMDDLDHCTVNKGKIKSFENTDINEIVFIIQNFQLINSY
ncbi:hypothetical protein IMG5_128830 [Ichthyophthirius multifiliis]|uniref:Deoxyuridine 5'-triphosphate nucleotidohydrolase n=1 Tax=Ichthyophthirius multifiliis TaxID=5932 RepID=G0QW28_ICHMU|nr:hypothetical protein IMG5_128830 [Ichthyophthirius multifiliis]EGR30580.1 hypothetical protein IMG5_128830 [Ichthyophthirius multifiliis]|eukprot:XP_004032167.1 hypothetical protein IMG5_128830 [Ichthyophthirius multifiliis]